MIRNPASLKAGTNNIAPGWGETQLHTHKYTLPISSLFFSETVLLFFLMPPCLSYCIHCLQSFPSTFVRPWSSRSEPGELCGRLAGCAEDDPVSRLLPGLGLHFFAACHTNHSRVSLPVKLPLSFGLSVSPCLRLTLLTCQVGVLLVGQLAGRLLGWRLVHVYVCLSLWTISQAYFHPSFLFLSWYKMLWVSLQNTNINMSVIAVNKLNHCQNNKKPLSSEWYWWCCFFFNIFPKNWLSCSWFPYLAYLVLLLVVCSLFYSSADSEYVGSEIFN